MDSIDQSCDSAMRAALGRCATALLSDNLDRMPGAVGLRPFHRIDAIMVGRAFTVQVQPGDNLHLHKALDMARPGDVMVVDGGAELSRALIGEIMVSIARARGLAGFVIDGAIRDSAFIAAGDFPVFARGAIHRGPWKNGPGRCGVTVSVGGMCVAPGDWVVGDHDGVVAFPPDCAADLLAAVQAQEAREAQTLARIAAGTYAGDYALGG